MAALSPGRVGRSGVPTQNLCTALRAAGRSVSGTESETPSTNLVSRSLETQSVLSTSLRPSSIGWNQGGHVQEGEDVDELVRQRGKYRSRRYSHQGIGLGVHCEPLRHVATAQLQSQRRQRGHHRRHGEQGTDSVSKTRPPQA